jgi:hypothetical protein
MEFEALTPSLRAPLWQCCAVVRVEDLALEGSLRQVTETRSGCLARVWTLWGRSDGRGRPWCSDWARGVLSAGRAVRRPARMAGTCVSPTAAGSCPSVDRRRGAAHEEPQRPIVAALLGACTERAGVHRAEHGPTRTINDGDDHLRAARRVEHDAVQLGPVVCHPHELTCGYRLHRRKRTPADDLASSRGAYGLLAAGDSTPRLLAAMHLRRVRGNRRSRSLGSAARFPAWCAPA